jgi:hypothetical protein
MGATTTRFRSFKPRSVQGEKSKGEFMTGFLWKNHAQCDMFGKS